MDRRTDQENGVLERSGERWQLRFRRRLAHAPEKVWRALVEPAHLAVWFPADIEGERAAGAPLRFVFRNGEGPTIDGEFLSFDPPRRLAFRWGEDEFHLGLEPDGEGSILTFVNILNDVGRAALVAAGWHVCLDALALDLAGEHVPWTPRERWQEVHPGYVARFGPEASTAAPPPRATG